MIGLFLTSVEFMNWTIADSRERRCKRWSVYPPDVIDLTVAEMDLPVAGPIADAVQDAVRRQAFGYPLPDDLTDLPAVAAEWLTERGLPVPASQIRLISDVIKAVVLGIRHFSRPGTPVAVVTPTYSRFFDAVEAAEREAIEVPMLHDDTGYNLDLDGIDAALDRGAETVLLCNPSNPVGRVFGAPVLSRLSAVVERHGAKLISDEIHAPLEYGDSFASYASVSRPAAAHSITLTSASKAWNVPGLRCAVVVLTNPADVAVWDRLPRASKGGISPLGIEATIAAFKEGQPWLSEALGLLDTNRKLVAEQLDAGGLGHVMHLPEATYLAWFDLREFGSVEQRRHLLDRAGVATTGGDEHGKAGAGFVRVNLASPPKVLTEAMDRIVDALRSTSPGRAR